MSNLIIISFKLRIYFEIVTKRSRNLFLEISRMKWNTCLVYFELEYFVYLLLYFVLWIKMNRHK